MTIRIKNWSKHQHFKDRTPPWIKLYREILDDPDWHDLDGESAKALVGLWLVASEDESRSGALPELRKLAFRLRVSESDLNQTLTKLKNWLIFDDISAISTRYQSDAPETETETETETEAEAEITDANASVVASKPTTPSCPHQEIIAAYHEILPSLTRVRDWTTARQAFLRKRWNENPERQSVDWWRGFFEYVSMSDFLMGRSPGRGGEPFECDLEWLVRPKNFVKVLEGKYERRAA